MPRVGGVAIYEDESGKHEFPTFTCFHCGKIVQLTQKATMTGMIGRDNMDEIGATCGCCGESVCIACSLTNDPWLRQLDRMEEEAYRRSLL